MSTDPSTEYDPERPRVPECQSETVSDPGSARPSAADGTEHVTPEQRPTLPTAGRKIPEVPGYEIISELGRGGMGVVYKARHLRLGRAVALKMVLAGAHAGPKELARFKAEAEAVAGLNHPNIVQIFEVGEHDGMPFFTLELCQGGSLIEKCAGGPIPAREAAGLVETVARAVAHAHAQGVVHRDLKPDNVLIGEKGEPKVTDFGLAKKVDSDQGITGTGAVMGTPSYMAPEQAGGLAKRVGPAADVWALGAVLYRLLTGEVPFKGNSPMGTVRKVLEEEPAPPRSVVPGVPRDLEVVCLKCLSKEPGKRYVSADALADDLRRWLNGHPIEARPAGSAERTWKWLRRNPAAAGAALALLIGVIASTSFAVAAGRARDAEAGQRRVAERRTAEVRVERDLKERQRRLAEGNARLARTNEEQALRERDKAVGLLNFLRFDILDQADVSAQADRMIQLGGADGRVGHDLTVREALDRAGGELTPELIGPRFPGQPSVAAAILQTVGYTYLRVGEPGKGVTYLERADATFTSALGGDHPETLDCRNTLAIAYLTAGRTGEAISLFEATLKRHEAAFGNAHQNTLALRNNLAKAYQDVRRLDEAIDLYRDTIRRQKDLRGEGDPDTIKTMNNLGVAYLESGQAGRAAELLEPALALSSAHMGEDHPHTRKCSQNLAAAYMLAGRLVEAIPLNQAGLRWFEAKLGKDHPTTVQARHNLAGALFRIGRVGDAIESYEANLEVLKAGHDDGHPLMMATRNNLAYAYSRAGRPGESVRLYEKLIEQYEATAGAGHPNTLLFRKNLASAHLQAGHEDEAVSLYESTLERAEASQGKDHPDTLYIVSDLGRAYDRVGRRDEAIRLFERAYDGLKARRFLTPDILPIQDNLLAAYGRSGRLPDQESLLRDVLERAKVEAPDGHPMLPFIHAQLGTCLLRQRKPEEAEAALRECLETRREAMPSSWLTADAESMLGEALTEQGRHAEAGELLRSGLSGMKAAFEAGKPEELPPPTLRTQRLLEATARLVRLFDATGDAEQTAEWKGNWASLLLSKWPVPAR